MNTIVVGGGASGLMAAYSAAKNGNDVILIEKNEKLGKKIYVTGKGRCNLTNDCSPENFLSNVVRGGKFLTGAIYSFPPQQTMKFFEEYGLALKVERGNRVFPVSDHASDVTKTLEKACRNVGVCFHLNETVRSVRTNDGAVSGIITDKGDYACKALILATGGVSYPATGSTGDGYRFAKETGHKIVPCVPSLVGINLKNPLFSAQGVSLKNVVLSARRGNKTVFSEMGEILVTHYGISGPLVLSCSAVINRIPMKEICLSVDLKPALNKGALDGRLLSDFQEKKNERMKSVMRGLLPAGLVSVVLNAAAVSPEKQANGVTKEERRRLIEILKALELVPESLRGFEEAVITSGGMDLAQVNPKTMESKLIRGLYFTGELLDVDALTGGFNLQIAFATGFIAGKSI